MDRTEADVLVHQSTRALNRLDRCLWLLRVHASRTPAEYGLVRHGIDLAIRDLRRGGCLELVIPRLQRHNEQAGRGQRIGTVLP